MNLRWLLLMAWRDSRKNRSRLFLFMGSISAGIAALVAIYSFGADLNRSVDEQAASLIGADFTVSANRPPDTAQARYLAQIGPTRSEEEQFNSMIFFPKNGSSRFVQVRALQGGFPYYGQLETQPQSAAVGFRNKQAALVDHSLMLQYGMKVGDSIKVGYLTFIIEGALDKAPNQSGFSASLAPVVYIPLTYMTATGLSQRGSRILYKWYYQFAKDTDVDALADRVTPWLDQHGMSHETVAMRKENTGKAFENMTHFLSLVGFAALLLGCIGVASAVQIYIREKSPTIAVMRCLGVTVPKAFCIYLFQVAGIGLIGSLIGVGAGVLLQWILPMAFGDLLPVEVKTAISWTAIGQGLVIGLVIALLFGFLPLLSIRRITPLYTLRSSYERSFQSLDPWRFPVYLGMIAFITCFARIQMKSWTQAAFFTLGLLLAYALLTLVAIGLRRVLRSIMRNSRWRFSVRQGFANLYRPNNQTIVLVVAIGLSTALVSVMFFTQDILMGQLALASSKSQANTILFDIQTDQEKSLDSLIKAQGMPVLEKVPILSMRINAIKGFTSDALKKLDTLQEWRWAMGEELRATYRDHLSTTEYITKGKWTPRVGPGSTSGAAAPPGASMGTTPGAPSGGAPGAGAGAPVPVSMEEGYAKRLGLHIGDLIRFNVQGMELTAEVGSLRKVEWNRMQTNFRFVFPAGVLEDAPQFRVILTRTASQEASAHFQQLVVRQFPTVSLIDLSAILSILSSIIDKIGYAIHFMASFSILTGLIVLIASVRNSKYQRLQESVLLRTLGASRRQVWTINALEYFFLGAISAITGLLIAVLGSWMMARYLFKLPFSIHALPAIGLLGVVCLLTTGIGLLNSRGILNRSTLEVLRTEV